MVSLRGWRALGGKGISLNRKKEYLTQQVQRVSHSIGRKSVSLNRWNDLTQ